MNGGVRRQSLTSGVELRYYWWWQAVAATDGGSGDDKCSLEDVVVACHEALMV